MDAYLSEHRRYLDKYYSSGEFVASGRQNPRIGGMIFCRADNRSRVEEIIKDDPFVIHSIAEYTITEVELTNCTDKFAEALAG